MSRQLSRSAQPRPLDRAPASPNVEQSLDWSMIAPERYVAPRAARAAAASAAPPVSPNLAAEVTFINGLAPDGTISSASYWGEEGVTAYKYGPTMAGTGATISYAFDAAAAFSATEQATFLKAFAMWQSVANVHFVAAASAAAADVLLKRGSDGNAYEDSGPLYLGAGATLGHPAGQAFISIDTSKPGFDLSGSFDIVGGYGISTVIHEVGHLLGLGHGGNYNGNVTAATDQYSLYDERLYTIMSYIFYGSASPKYAASYLVTGTDWGLSPDGYRRQAPHSVGQIDILAIQQLYGAPVDGPLTGGQHYGFNSNITGALQGFFDFTIDTKPVVTLYNQGIGNILDLSGYAVTQTISLVAGAFSSVAGLTNNLSIATGTRIDTVYGGSGDDTIVANDNGDHLYGGAGNDMISGGSGADTLDGGGGTDTLAGGAGDDLYLVDAAGATIVEAAGGGTDTVRTSLTGYVLPANVERLVYTGSAAQSFTGTPGDNDVTGGVANDYFDFSQGGNDTASGGGGADAFFFGAAFTAADRVDGGAGADQIGLQGNYTGANRLVLDATTVAGVETIAVLAGFSYDLTTNDANIAAGQILTVSAATLGAGNALTFNGADETDGRIVVYGGLGTDTITTGSGNDGIYFGRDGRFNPATDHVDGGAGTDQLALDGSYTVTISGAQIVNIETLALLDGSPTPALYNLTLADDWAGAGQTRTVYFATLRSGATIDGSAESNGKFVFFGGNGDDVLKGGAGNDVFHGGPGADTLGGGAGADTFVYDLVANSIGSSHDTIVGFDPGIDKIDLPFSVTAVDAARTGALSAATLDAQLASALATLGAHHAVQFTATSGDLSGHIFEVIDANNVVGYQAGADLVIDLQGPVAPITTPAPFV